MSKGTSNFDGQTVSVDRADENGNVILCKCATGSIPSAAAGYAVGCILIDTTTGLLYSNTGSVTSCTFTSVGVDAPGDIALAENKILLGNSSGVAAATTRLSSGMGYGMVVKPLNGTTSVNVFGTTNGFAATITGVFVSTLGTTSATVTIKGTGGATIGTITGGASAGTMVGVTSALANTSITAAGTCTVVSSKTDDTSYVFIGFTVA